MKLNKEVEKLIFDAVITANSVKIESFVIDEHGIRGTDDGKMVVMLLPSFDLEVPFDGIAIGDVELLAKRYAMHESNDPSHVSIDVKDDLTVKTIGLKSKNLNIGFRCIEPKRINAPKRLNDSLLCSFELNEDALDMIRRGAMIMKAEEVLFSKAADADTITMEMVDINRSQFTFEIDGGIETDEHDCTFAHRYPIKTLLGALKNSDDNYVDIGRAASLTIRKNGISIIIPPRV